MKPNANGWDVKDIAGSARKLRAEWERTELTQAEAARRLGINYRLLKFQLAGERKVPYLVYFGMASLRQ